MGRNFGLQTKAPMVYTSEPEQPRTYAMGARELRAAFNAVSSPAYVCSMATLYYDRSSGTEMQILTFSGRAADGAAFTFKSRPVRAHEDVNLVAAETAQKMLEQDTP